MTTPTNPIELFTPFLPTTYNVPEDDERLSVFLVDKLSNFADVINEKRIGSFTQDSENLNGEKWIYDTTKKVRTGYQVIKRIPSFVNDSYPMPLNDVNPQFVISQVWGSASKPCSSVGAGDGDYFSFFSEGNSKISFTMSDTTITITTTVDLSAYSGFIVIQYIRDGV